MRGRIGWLHCPTITANCISFYSVVTELIIGYALPGRPVAMMMFKTYGYITMLVSVFISYTLCPLSVSPLSLSTHDCNGVLSVQVSSAAIHIRLQTLPLHENSVRILFWALCNLYLSLGHVHPSGDLIVPGRCSGHKSSRRQLRAQSSLASRRGCSPTSIISVTRTKRTASR